MMKRVLEPLVGSWLGRVQLLIGLVAVLGFAAIFATMTPRNRSILGLDLAQAVGFFLPAIVLGAAWGWIRYSKLAWLWTTVVLAALSVVLLVVL